MIEYREKKESDNSLRSDNNIIEYNLKLSFVLSADFFIRDLCPVFILIFVLNLSKMVLSK